MLPHSTEAAQADGDPRATASSLAAVFPSLLLQQKEVGELYTLETDNCQQRDRSGNRGGGLWNVKS